MTRTTTTPRLGLLLATANGPVATTGNLMHPAEAGCTGLVDHDATSRRALGALGALEAYAALTVVSAGGAVVGAFATHAWSVHAIWIPAALLADRLARTV